jgi:four helix bundle protein
MLCLTHEIPDRLNEVHRLIHNCDVRMDFKYLSQLTEAADGIESNLAEGYKRDRTGEFSQFTRYAQASLAEARTRLRAGVVRRYFTLDEITNALTLAKRCDDAMTALQRSFGPYLKDRRRRHQSHPPQRRRRCF